MGLKDTRSVGRIVIDPNDAERRLRRRAGTSLGTERRARRLQDDATADGRGRSAVRRREHRRHRPRDRSDESAGALRGDVSAAAAHVGLQRRRPGLGHLQDDRRRRDVDEARRTACPPATRAASRSRSTRPIRKSSTRRSKRTRRTAASIARSTPARRGRRRRRSTRGRTTSRRSASTRATANQVYTLGSNRGFYFSNDGGKTFTELFSNVHGEDHALWVDPDARQSPDHRRRRRRVDLVGSRPARGTSAATCRSASSTRSTSTTACRSASAAACRTTACGACRARCAIATASPTAMAWNIGGGDGFHAHFDPANNVDGAAVVAERQRGVGEHRDARAPGRAARHGRSSAPVQPAAWRARWSRRVVRRGRGRGALRPRRTRRRLSLELGHADHRVAPRSQRRGTWARRCCSRAPTADRAGRRSAAISR